MTRKSINQKQLSKLIQAAAQISQNLGSIDGYGQSPALHDKVLVRRTNKACEFLRKAHTKQIINLDILPCNRFVTKGVDAYQHTHMDGSKETYIVPKDVGYSNKPFEPNIRLFSASKFFADAVRHAGAMAKAIQNEPKQLAKKGGSVSLRVTEPYGQTDWKPAKLTA